jgi:ABC-type polysaccharide/polyol phosphate transport system ATPase subunit
MKSRKENPYLKIGDSNDRATKGTSDYVWALQDINFEVGRKFGYIGKNGAGSLLYSRYYQRLQHLQQEA